MATQFAAHVQIEDEPRRYIVNAIRDAGSVCGPAVAVLKCYGKPLYFATLEEAQKCAAENNAKTASPWVRYVADQEPY